jgi:heme ABC exporter ATP-binding subunit CcmA
MVDPLGTTDGATLSMWPIPMTQVVHLRQAVALSGHFPVLAGVDLSVDEGEVVVLVGPNGAGKTSVLRACAGLVAVNKGEALVLGYDLRRDRSSVRRHVGMIGHSPALYDELTVGENIRFALRGGRRDKQVAAGDSIARVGLPTRLERTPASRLSAGQRKRVGLAILFARRLPLWLLDEPHAGLDAEARAILDEMVKEAAATGTAVLMASHELPASAPGADRVTKMSGGRVVGELPVQVPPAPAPKNDLSEGANVA